MHAWPWACPLGAAAAMTCKKEVLLRRVGYLKVFPHVVEWVVQASRVGCGAVRCLQSQVGSFGLMWPELVS